MTLLGKVFIFLILALSIVFFTISVSVNSTHIDNKKIAAEAQKEASDLKAKNTQLSNQIEEYRQQLAIEQIARRASLGALQTELESMRQQLSDKTAEAVQLNAQVTQLTQTVNATNAQLKASTDDNDLLRKQIASAEDNLSNVLSQYADAKDQQNRLQGEFETLEARVAQMSDEYVQTLAQLEKLDIDPNTPLDAPPEVNGKVLAVSTNGLVEISLGRDDGMRKGFTLDVTRGQQYLGRLLVTNVADNKCVAEILTPFQRGVILQGDRVDSKLY